MLSMTKNPDGNTDLAQYAGKKILVTGGSGFIGSMLCVHLERYGAELHVVSRTDQAPNDTITWWKGDLSDMRFIRHIFTTIRPDIVFHLASEVTGSRELDIVLPTLNANLVSAVNILVAGTQAGCGRIVMTGSLEEPEGEAANTTVPASPYAAAKWAASAYARMFHALYQTPVALARLFMVFGPGQRDLRKIVPYVILSLLRGESPKLSSGTRPVDWIYVEDVVNGLLIMGVAPGINGKTIDLGSGESTTVRNVVEAVCDVMQAPTEPEFGAIADRPMEQIRIANIRDTYAELGWKPQIALKEGLRRTADWYKNKHQAGEIE